MGWRDELRRRFPTRSMLGADELSQILSDAGFDEVATSTRERRFVFADIDAYLRWMRTQAFGVLVNRLDEPGLRQLREICEKRLTNHQRADGYELIKRVDLTVAHRG
jgi:hypothetical protein